MSQKKLEKYLTENIQLAFSDYIASFNVVSSAAKKKDTAAEIARIERKQKKLYNLYMDDLIDAATYKEEYNSFKKQLEELRSIPFSPAVDTRKKTEELLSGDWISVYSSFTDLEKNAFWKSFIDKIIIDVNGNIDIIFL